MYWFKWLELFQNDKDSIKVKNFMVQCNVAMLIQKQQTLEKESRYLFESVLLYLLCNDKHINYWSYWHIRN